MNPAPTVTPMRSQIADWLPSRPQGRDVNKGTFGHVLILAGSTGFIGAAVLASEAAARAGAGLVTLVVPEDLQQTAMICVSPVVMTCGLPRANDGSLGSEAVEVALGLARGATAAAIGPGLGHTAQTATFILEFISRCPVALVVDADALTVLSHENDHGRALIRERSPTPTILTPHPGEMGRLLGMETHQVQNDREKAASMAGAAYGCSVLLKGAGTLAATADGRLFLNPNGNPGMATGGAGDVLTGVVASLLAQGLDPVKASIVGAYLHGLAGDLGVSAQGGTAGLIATDLIAYLPQAIAALHREPGH